MCHQNRTDSANRPSSEDLAEKKREIYLAQRAATLEMMRKKFEAVHGKDVPFKILRQADMLRSLMD